METPKPFKLAADYTPGGDQAEAIEALVKSINDGNRFQTLLGVTGSGKTFTMANVIEKIQRPTLIISHNKTLAAQLYSEFKNFFPDNAVEYFVSYYDYYQPEAYVPSTDTYIEKDSSINDDIERLRIAATSSLISRKDVLVVASVSCIYGLGSPEDFKALMISIRVGDDLGRDALLHRMVDNQYNRNDVSLTRGNFRVRGDVVDIFPAYMETAIRVEFWGDEIDSIKELDPLTGNTGASLNYFDLYPANQYVTTKDKIDGSIEGIRNELKARIAYFESRGLLLEAQRISMRTEYDLEQLQELGFCSGIENYSRWFSGRKAGERPFCLIDFFPDDLLIILDESHVSLPQIGGMYEGDRSRKTTLVEHGFRLPSAMDNRPMSMEEFMALAKQVLFVSATPRPFEMQNSAVVAEQIIRPTGLLDPIMELRSTKGQVEDLIGEIKLAVDQKERVLVTTLTKRMSEDLTTFFREAKVRVEYLHSDIDAVERIEILRRLRSGDFDVLVGVNLLREGLDLPEVALVAILDADKEGFLRNYTSLVQTAGRAARHEKGRVILYADKMNDSIQKTIEVTAYRRERQEAYNTEHGIIPTSIRRGIQSSLIYKGKEEKSNLVAEALGTDERKQVIAEMEIEMLQAAESLEFERAALLRDQISLLRSGKDSSPSNTKSSKGYGRRKNRRY
ncbi:MAG: excinuclease ABC subunit UvrB [Verrucomicrobia bacterium]|nr:excinuclease ABC subunit UvrB [Verrucomicrobiota bacterium]MDA1065835.1 excinuclease ABC subunit UvrB [Verrucomicrobiota bacterium]